jgi:hypothetical protein
VPRAVQQPAFGQRLGAARGVFAREQLERHLARQAAVPGPVDRAGGAAADLLGDIQVSPAREVLVGGFGFFAVQRQAVRAREATERSLR